MINAAVLSSISSCKSVVALSRRLLPLSNIPFSRAASRSAYSRPISTHKGVGAEFALKDVIHHKIQAGTRSLNPYAFNERKYACIPAKKPKRIAVVGGGLAGCELAYDLAVKGKRPVIIEAQDDLIRGMNVSAPNSVLMRDLLRFHKVPVYFESRVLEVQYGRVVFENAEGRHEIEADSIVNAIGFDPGTALCPKKQKHVHIIGDAASVSNLKNAIWSANDLAVALSK